MPSPFPGMNPFLEQEGVFHDFHQTFVPFIREALVGPLRASYVVKLEEYLFIHELPSEQRRIIGRADVSISPARGTAVLPPSTTTATAPVRRRLPIATETERHSYLEIREREGMRLVTVIELLSPSNKRPGSDREQYLSKREELFRGGVHLVEIDLLRGWPRLPVEDFPPSDYCIVVSRAEEWPEVDVWPIQLRERLPIVPVPLRPPDPPVNLDLQAVLHRVHDSAGYETSIYSGTPQPPLSPDDEQWARSITSTKS